MAPKIIINLGLENILKFSTGVCASTREMLVERMNMCLVLLYRLNINRRRRIVSYKSMTLDWKLIKMNEVNNELTPVFSQHASRP